jgi:hypothetical protein
MNPEFFITIKNYYYYLIIMAVIFCPHSLKIPSKTDGYDICRDVIPRRLNFIIFLTAYL